MLSHNIFAYCNNNPVNAKDPNGFRPVYIQGEETDAMRHGGLAIPVKGASTARAVGKIEGVGGIGIVLTGVAVWGNYHSGYSKEEAFWRSAIDVGAAALAIGVGCLTPVGWGIGLGMAIGIGAEIGKNYLWGRD